MRKMVGTSRRLHSGDGLHLGHLESIRGQPLAAAVISILMQVSCNRLTAARAIALRQYLQAEPQLLCASLDACSSIHNLFVRFTSLCSIHWEVPYVPEVYAFTARNLKATRSVRSPTK
jgi:hypothetical protein